ncbi:MAG: type II toxin-antitoxin system HicA family toxin [Planctomycetes bacterium]|nr:type II toxin-antitoxin system HicA family toxin [Planctomycetota bacterium]
MKQISGKQLVRALQRHGWILLRVHGSHHIFGKPGVTVRLSVPVHGNQPLKLGLLRHLLKSAGLEEQDI